MIVSVEDLIDTSDMKITDEEIYQSLVELDYIEEENNMKYEYENQNEPRKLSTNLAVVSMKLKLAFQNQDNETFNETLNELEQISKKIENFKPIIKINVED